MVRWDPLLSVLFLFLSQQIDDSGHAILGGMIEDLGLKIHCNARVTEFMGGDAVSGLAFSNEGWDDLDVGMVVVSAGIRYGISSLTITEYMIWRMTLQRNKSNESVCTVACNAARARRELLLRFLRLIT